MEPAGSSVIARAPWTALIEAVGLPAGMLIAVIEPSAWFAT